MAPEAQPGRRRPTLRDGLVLMAATAVGLAALRWGLKELGGEPAGWLSDLPSRPEGGWTGHAIVLRIINLSVLLLSLVGGWIFVLPFCKGGRFGLRRFRHPGMAACLAACLGILVSATRWLVTVVVGDLASLRPPSSTQLAIQQFLSNDLIPPAGFAVAVTWLMLALSGRWRPARDWADFLGIGLGLVWMAAGIVWSIRNYIFSS